MVLNSLRFAAFFFIFLIILLLLPKRARKIWLFFGNCLFYLSFFASGQSPSATVPFIIAFILLMFSAMLVWFCGIKIRGSRRMEQGSGTSDRRSAESSYSRFTEKLFLILPILWNVGMLVFFKYTGLIGSLLERLRGGLPISAGDILVPVGISFYTLRCISYIIDVRI